ncbi:sodium:proton antiporter [Pseudomonas sp. o96-267]|uniref:sodium:proton antiporter n=1 Tax=Pseudomonas sp. o96-267 TaxID=2479853 RepID=UPI000F7AB62A|nr:sodium:proton antiporter [Pseudomonas sp. o96-267]RRV29041.1 sodium:proton antiporter [Pseudomonas sp. o96-267]RRV43230.1 sodium:proton antiporter [Pseudomonas sp. o96-267]
MTVVLFWLLALAIYALVAVVGGRRLIPIVGQLLVAALAIPALLLLWAEPHWQLSASDLLAPDWLELAYGLCFALLLGYILSDVIDLDLSPACVKIALPSFLVPMLAGLACSLWLLPGERGWLSAVGIGLLFSITAIPVLYLFLQSIGYPPADSKRLLHAAILMDFMCWSLFGLAQGSSQPATLLWPLLAALLPLLLRAARLRHPSFYSLPFFALMLALQQLELNALVFGIGYMLCLGYLRQPFVLPLAERHWKRAMNGLAVPLILTYGVLRVDFHGLDQHLSWLLLVTLLALPVISKVLGSWLGLHWADPAASARIKWRESLLLNIRGLTEIVFLNLLLQLQLIDSTVYFGLLLMSLFSTLLPALLGRHAANHEAKARYEIS